MEGIEQVAYTAFYASYHEAMQELSDAQYGRVAKAINEYAFYGIEPSGLKTKLEKIIFIMAKPTIDTSVSARLNGKKGGAPKGNQNAKKTKTRHPCFPETDAAINTETAAAGVISTGTNQQQPQNNVGCFPETTNGKGKGNENVHENEKEKVIPFLGGLVHPNLSEIAERVKTLGAEWNTLAIKPPFTKQLINLNRFEQQDLLSALNGYPDTVILSAIKNYKHVRASPEAYDPGACAGYTFITFLTKGVERYRDEAEPFEEFRKRGTAPPQRQSLEQRKSLKGCEL